MTSWLKIPDCTESRSHLITSVLSNTYRHTLRSIVASRLLVSERLHGVYSCGSSSREITCCERYE